MGALFFPILILVIVVIIPLFLLFLILLKMFTFRTRRKSPRTPPASSGKIHHTDDVVDIECEVMDEKDGK
jgi:hypothetical protein